MISEQKKGKNILNWMSKKADYILNRVIKEKDGNAGNTRVFRIYEGGLYLFLYYIQSDNFI